MEQEAEGTAEDVVAVVCYEVSKDGDGGAVQEDPPREPPPMLDLPRERPPTPDPPREPPPTPDLPAVDAVDADPPTATLHAAAAECRSARCRCCLSRRRGEVEERGGAGEERLNGERERDGERGAGRVNKLPLSSLCTKKERKTGSQLGSFFTAV